jgi:multiple sugar transport system permease protein
MTAFKSVPDAITYPPKLIFKPSLEGFVNLFTQRTRQPKAYLDSLPPPATWYEKIVRKRQMVIAGPSRFFHRFVNSIAIGFGSTFFSVFLGTLAAYGFSRFRIPAKDDLLFFILSTRMFPPIAAAVPIFLMYRTLGLNDTYLGMITLYTVVNLSLSVWLLKGFAATAIFCLIFAWNEYAFAILLTFREAQTLPPFIPTIIGEGGLDWPAISAATMIFLLPVVVFTILLRKHLLRGITFGAVRR